MWTPAIQEGQAPLYARIADALAADIARGALAVGSKLPPHRDLAFRLAIGVGTITRAYEEAARRGLIEAHVGRGSFVASPAQSPDARDDATFDMAMNIAPLAPTLARLPEAMSGLGRRADLAERLSYAPPLGHEADRRAGAEWLRRVNRLAGADWRRTICTLGAQHAMTLLFGALAGPGATILCENVNYVGLKALARQHGYLLRGVAMDGEGMCPDGLQCAAARIGARIVYTVPTLHNPTARVMSPQRRAAIAEVARRCDLAIVEDDIYAQFAATLPIEPIANLAPERSYLISGLSKAVAPGLRAGYLALPDDSLIARLTEATRATIFAPASLPFALATQLIESGMADAILREVHDEVAARTALAERLLTGRLAAPATPASLHIWLPMSDLEAERAAGRALRAGIQLMAPGAGAIDAEAESGLRVCLGTIATRARLEVALTRLGDALAGAVAPHERALI